MGHINRAAFLQHYGDDLEIIEDLIEIFESTYPETVKNIEVAIEAKNFKDLELHAHTLKGMCSNFFCEELKEACFSLEVMGRNSSLNDEEAKIALIKTQLPEVIEELKNFEG